MAETRDEAGPSEQGTPTVPWWPSDFMEKFASVTLGSQEESLSNKESPRNAEQDAMSPQTASQILWNTGMLSDPIPNGFYSVIPVRTKFDIICTTIWSELGLIICFLFYSLLPVIMLRRCF